MDFVHIAHDIGKDTIKDALPLPDCVEDRGTHEQKSMEYDRSQMLSKQKGYLQRGSHDDQNS